MLKENWFPLGGKSCLLKWGQVSLYLWENKSSSCHRNKNADIDDSYDFHNTVPVVEHRQKMLNNQWPSDGRGCEHCRDQESHGGMSDRLQWLSMPGNQRYVPVELYKDPTLLKIKPTMLSIHFNNKCNLKCVYCGPSLSSSWMKEILKYDEGQEWFEEDPWTMEKSYKERLAKFYVWMENNYSSLQKFDILGGEPFIQPETFDCIDWMTAHPNPNVDFEIYSNMQVKPELFKRGMEKVRALAKTCREVVFTASIDCWGPASEYIRNGLDLDTFEQNMTYLVEHCPEVRPTMNWTVSSLSIPYTADLIRKVIKWNKTRYVSVNYNKCIDPIIHDPHIMPPGTYTRYIDELHKLNKIMYTYGNNINSIAIEYTHGIFNEIENSPAQPDKIKLLIKELIKLDQRRNTNWKTTFPWLVDIELAL
jgi:sulfatase maturation enzyme AslB (radical SAM superfamily)